jgi:hypothetical protein
MSKHSNRSRERVSFARSRERERETCEEEEEEEEEAEEEEGRTVLLSSALLFSKNANLRHFCDICSLSLFSLLSSSLSLLQQAAERAQSLSLSLSAADFFSSFFFLASSLSLP